MLEWTRISSVVSLRLLSWGVEARPRAFVCRVLRGGVRSIYFWWRLMASKSKGLFSFINVAGHPVFFKKVVIPILDGFRSRLTTYNDSVK